MIDLFTQQNNEFLLLRVHAPLAYGSHAHQTPIMLQIAIGSFNMGQWQAHLSCTLAVWN
jgi:hypothetical protein